MSATSFSSATGNQQIDGILADQYWSGDVITYRFPTRTSEYFGESGGWYTFSGFSSLNASQKAAVQSAFEMITSYTGLTFEASTATNVHLRFAEATTVDDEATGTAFAYLPSTVAWAGDVFFNRNDYNSPTVGSYAFLTFIHEIGHAMGLSHSHETDFYGATPTAFDALEYTVMSYHSYPGSSLSGGYTAVDYPEKFMQSDILALQSLYGANFNHNDGDDTYVFDPNQSVIFKTIWDGGGTDLYDFSLYTQTVNVTLEAGAFSVTGQEADLHYSADISAQGSVYNSLLYQEDKRSLIENATGGSGNDKLTGNELDNELIGGFGDDELIGLSGKDVLIGGGGNDMLSGGDDEDTAVFSGARSEYDISVNGLGQTVITHLAGGSDSTDTAVGVERFQFADGIETAEGFVPFNTAPTVTVSDIVSVESKWIRLTSLVEYADRDGENAVSFEIKDTEGTNSFWVDGGIVDATQGYVFAASDLSGFWLLSDAAASVQTLEIRAFDGTSWGDWSSFTLTTELGNQKPNFTVDDLSVGVGSAVSMVGIGNYSDADGDAISSYQVWDSKGGHNFELNGEPIDASSGYVLTPAEFANLTLNGDSSVSSQELWMRVNDGTEWSSWDSFQLATTGQNTAPTVTVADFSSHIGQWTRATDFVNFSDLDNDAPVTFEVIDNVGGNNFWYTGSGLVDASSGFTFPGNNLEDLWIKGDAATSVQPLQIRAFDGQDWSDWESFNFETTVSNHAPTVNVSDMNVGIGAFAAVSSAAVVLDADNDAITSYQIWDSVGVDNFHLPNEGLLDANAGYVVSAADFSDLTVQGDAGISSQTLWLRATDGTDWSAWDSFSLITG